MGIFKDELIEMYEDINIVVLVEEYKKDKKIKEYYEELEDEAFNWFYEELDAIEQIKIIKKGVNK